MAYEDNFKRADAMAEYKLMLVDHLDVLTMKMIEWREKQLNLQYDELLISRVVSEMLGIMSHLLPKLEGGGKKTEMLYTEMSKFKIWETDIMKPRIEEKDKIPELYDLILQAYDKLGLSTL